MELHHRRDDSAAAPPATADAATIGWFAARQPAVVRFLEEHLWRPDGDAFGIGLDAACRLFRVFTALQGSAPPRLGRSALATGLAAMAEGQAGSRRVQDLCAWVDDHLDDSPVPLTLREVAEVMLALHALVFALEAVSGDHDEDDEILY